jgi:sugar (pentulose or hexulose) kinase
MENSLMANLQKGTGQEDLFAGLAYSIVQNYINRVVGKRAIGNRIFFQGGVAFNKSVVAAFEKYLGKKITVPPHHEVTGAIGMAIIAKRHVESRNAERRTQNKETDTQQVHADRAASMPEERTTTFKGFELSRRPYAILYRLNVRDVQMSVKLTRSRLKAKNRISSMGDGAKNMM